jgi:hypothetical protein
MVPRQIWETRSPVLPRVLYCMSEVSFSAAIAFWNWIQRRRVGNVDIGRIMEARF